MPVSDDSFAAFYTASYHRLLGQLFAVTGDLAEAENVLQEAYARAFVRWSRVRAYDLPEAWVRRVALNLAGMAAKRLRRRDAKGAPRCIDGVDSVVDQRAVVEPALVGTFWPRTTDVTVFLVDGASAAQRRAIRARLEATGGVWRVSYESPADALRGLRERFSAERLRLTPGSPPGSFRVACATQGRRARSWTRSAAAGAPATAPRASPWWSRTPAGSGAVSAASLGSG
jgi:DNA-directed RNA polymerase specialized sigma24 family protein